MADASIGLITCQARVRALAKLVFLSAFAAFRCLAATMLPTLLTGAQAPHLPGFGAFCFFA